MGITSHFLKQLNVSFAISGGGAERRQGWLLTFSCRKSRSVFAASRLRLSARDESPLLSLPVRTWLESKSARPPVWRLSVLTPAVSSLLCQERERERDVEDWESLEELSMLAFKIEINKNNGKVYGIYAVSFALEIITIVICISKWESSSFTLEVKKKRRINGNPPITGRLQLSCLWLFLCFGVFRTERFFVVTSCHGWLGPPVSDGGVWIFFFVPVVQ